MVAIPFKKPQYTPEIPPQISWPLAELIFGGSQIYRDGRRTLATGFFGGRQNRLSKAWLVYAFHMHKR